MLEVAVIKPQISSLEAPVLTGRDWPLILADKFGSFLQTQVRKCQRSYMSGICRSKRRKTILATRSRSAVVSNPSVSLRIGTPAAQRDSDLLSWKKKAPIKPLLLFMVRNSMDAL